jgi:hypothetical protein
MKRGGEFSRPVLEFLLGYFVLETAAFAVVNGFLRFPVHRLTLPFAFIFAPALISGPLFCYGNIPPGTKKPWAFALAVFFQFSLSMLAVTYSGVRLDLLSHAIADGFVPFIFLIVTFISASAYVKARSIQRPLR